MYILIIYFYKLDELIFNIGLLLIIIESFRRIKHYGFKNVELKYKILND